MRRPRFTIASLVGLAIVSGLLFAAFRAIFVGLGGRGLVIFGIRLEYFLAALLGSAALIAATAFVVSRLFRRPSDQDETSSPE